MPRNGSQTLEDHQEKSRLVVECRKCGRTGRYSIRRMIEERGLDYMLTDFQAEIEGSCERVRTPSIYDRCEARMAVE